ncbi:extended synaptotagmin-like protein 2-like protein variant [Lottia gigantea]|uniref:Extended synaptotagmin-like protein 2-like protein variant n=1 Tax=Lottia gigantea TaxID=225164 RepID=V4AS72_LOTGI|nr:extended synaptotagmin-like protein 2-like protein variant [Lottia gigantea]ESO96571.1 extended synaptotagmin-like protein 2-like protein variant [Lottia gigantea]
MPPPAKPEEKPAESKAKRTAVLEDTLLFNAVKNYFKYAGVVLGVWGFGYFSFSPSWLLLGLVLFIWKEKNKTSQKLQIAISQEAAKDERAAILARVEDLPSWVFFPDVERAEWLNKMIQQLWPYIGDYVKDLLHKSIEPAVKKSLPVALAASFRFSQIDLGDIPPRIGGIKVYTENVRRDEIYMDLEIIYSSDSEITVQAKGINAGIKDLQIHGTMRVIFKPLISRIPLFGGLSVFFLNNPTVDFNLTSLANAFDLPGLSDMLKNIVQEQIANIMVLPNRIPVSMVKGLDLNKLRYPQPQGVLRINIIEAKELKKADIGITGKGKSDPYVICSVGAQKFQTKVIDNTVEPVWNEDYEAIVDVADGQLLTLDVNDRDPGNDDDHLGGLSVDISQAKSQGIVDEWLPLEDVKKGMVHIKLTWLYLANDPLELDRVVQKMEEDRQTDEKFSSCILLVNLDSARDLPRGKKSLNEPSPFCQISVGTLKKESWVKWNTNEPRWEQNFRFLIHNPNFQNLDVDVMDKKTGKSLGDCNVKLKELLGATDMVLDRKFPLKNTASNAYLNMRLTLRVLTTVANEEWLQEGTMIDEALASTEEGSSVDDQGKPGSSIDPASASGSGPVPSVPSSKDEKIVPAVSTREETTIRKRTNATPADDGKGAHGLGKIQITLRYNAQRNRFIVVIHKCTNLLALDSNNLSDPYIRLYLLPDKSSDSKRKTKVIKDNLNPVFDETLEFPVSPSDVKLKLLEVAIKNKNSLFSSSKKMMGIVTIDLANFDIYKALTDWYDLQPEDSDERVSLETEI